YCKVPLGFIHLNEAFLPAIHRDITPDEDMKSFATGGVFCVAFQHFHNPQCFCGYSTILYNHLIKVNSNNSVIIEFKADAIIITDSFYSILKPCPCVWLSCLGWCSCQWIERYFI